MAPLGGVVSGTQDPVTIGERLDSLPLSVFHWKLTAASGLGWMFDAMDSGLVAFVLAMTRQEWGLDPEQMGLIGSAGMLGMLVGAAGSGTLADRFGRRSVFMATLAFFSLATGLCGFAAGFLSLAALRFLVGAGLGGELPVASTLVTEFAPREHRGKLVVFLESFWAFGWALAAVVAYLFMPRFGWRAAFFLGSLPALYTLYLRRSVPESARFLEARGRWDEAVAVVRDVENRCGVEAAELKPGRVAVAKPAFSALWEGARARRTLMLWILWLSMVYSYYGIFIWLPSLLVAGGHTVTKSFEYVLIITLAQVPGYFSAAWLVDRLGRKRTLSAYMLGCAAACYGFGFLASSSGSIVFWGCLISFFNLGAWGVVYTYTPEVYPTELRSSGAGWASAVGRLGGIAAPFTIGWIMKSFNRPDLVFAHVAAVVLAGVLAVLILGEETRGKSLESIAAA